MNDDDYDGSCHKQTQYQENPQQPQHPGQTPYHSGERVILIDVILMLIESG